jgi:hypothetical protein
MTLWWLYAPKKLVKKWPLTRGHSNYAVNVGKGSIASEWVLEDGRRPESQFDCRVFFRILPLKYDWRKFSLSAPPRWYHKQTSVPDVWLNVGKGSIASEWALEDGRRPESQFDCRVFFSDSPLKNMMDGNLVFPCPPRWYHKQTSVPNVGLTLGKGSIALEWALDDEGQRWKPFDCSPLKNMIGRKISISGLPWWYHLKRSVPDIRLAVEKRSIVLE